LSEIAIVTEQLKRHEGFREKPYYDTVGKLTIGYGWNLDDDGITKEEAEQHLIKEIAETVADLQAKLPDLYASLNEYRKAVLINMAYNMGIGNKKKGLLSFQNTLAMMRVGNYEGAAKGMLSSQWANQVGNRAKELAKIMKQGYA